MSEASLQNIQSGPGGPGRAKVGQGPLLNANSLPDKDSKKWTASQPETYPKEDTYVAGSSGRALIDEFLAAAKSQGRTVQGLIGLRQRVPRLFDYLEETGLELFALKARDAQGYIRWLSSKHSMRDGAPLSARSVIAYHVAASSFYEYLRRRGYVIGNPLKEARHVRGEKRIPRGLLKEPEMELLLEELSRFDEQCHLKAAIKGYKVHVVAELMYATGLRVSEVASLRVEDIDFSRSMIRVQEAKGGHQRIAFLGEFAREVLRLYVERLKPLVSSKWNLRNSQLLFGTAWSTFGKILNRELARTCTSLSLPPMRSHGFRHALGYHLLRAGCNIRHIQSILGHRLLRNTEIYTKVEKEDLRGVVDACHPRKWKRDSDERT
jgi:integrase/recombinase XerC